MSEAQIQKPESMTVIQTDKGEVKLSPGIVKQYLVSGGGNVSNGEVMMFMALCKYQALNPFIKEAFLIKYGSSPATMVVGKDVFVKRANKHPDHEGFEAGITILTPNGELERRVGTLILPDETLVGGWAKAYRKGYRVPMEAEVSLLEFDKKQSSWKTMPGTMIRKVALVTCLRETYPEELQALYCSEEMGVDGSMLSDKEIIVQES